MRTKLGTAELAAQADRLRLAGLASAAEQVARAWVREAHRAGLSREIVRASTFLMRLALDRQEPRLALQYGEEAMGHAVGSGAPDAIERARLHLHLAKAAWRLGWFQRAEAYSDAADVCAQESPLPPLVAGHAALVRGLMAAERGDLSRATVETAQARAFALACGERGLRFTADSNLGVIAYRMGDLEGAEAQLQPLSAESGGAERGRVLVDLARIALERGDIALSASRAREGLDACRTQPARLDELQLAPLYGLLGRLCNATGAGQRQARRLLQFGAHWYEVAGRQAQAAVLREEAASCRGASAVAGVDGLLEYVGELVTLTVVYGGRVAPEHHLRRVALLAEQFARPSGPGAQALQHAALLHELPADGRWFCRLCDEGRAAEDILSRENDPDHALLRALDGYETALARRLGWQQALEQMARCLGALGSPAVERFGLAHSGA